MGSNTSIKFRNLKHQTGDICKVFQDEFGVHVINVWSVWAEVQLARRKKIWLNDKGAR